MEVRCLALRTRRGLLLAILACMSPLASANPAPADEVMFAGASYAVDAAQVAQRFPLVSQVVGAGSGQEPSAFERQLREAVLAATPRQFAISNRDPFHQSDTRSGVAKALSMAFSHEAVELQQLGSKTVAVYDIAAQVLFFDYGAAAKHVIAAYPVRLRYTDTTDRPPSPAQRQAVVRTMLDPASESGLVRVWLRKMVEAAPRGGDRLVRVELPVFEAKAAAMQDGEGAAHDVARFLEGVISDEWNVPMVPRSTGQAISGKMVQVFANGDAAEFELPEPTFRIGTTVRDLRKAVSPLEGGQRVAYGAFITSAVQGPLGTIAELRFKDVLSVTLTDLEPVRLDDRKQLARTLQSVLVQSVGQVKARDRSWTEANSTTPDANAQLDAIRTRLLAR